MVHRAGAEAWIRRVVEGVRAGRIAADEGSPVAVIARYRDLDGRPLDTETAGLRSSATAVSTIR